MVKVKGNIATFTGKDRKLLLDAAKKAGLTPRQYLFKALETMAQNVIFFAELDRQEELKNRIHGVPVDTIKK